MNANFDATIRRSELHAALAAAILCGVALTATPAHAGDREVPTKIVSYADLNLASEAGARTLYFRLQAAANQVCAAANGASIKQKVQWRQCLDHAIAQSVEAIDQPVLTAYHLKQAGKAETPTRVANDE